MEHRGWYNSKERCVLNLKEGVRKSWLSIKELNTFSWKIPCFTLWCTSMIKLKVEKRYTISVLILQYNNIDRRNDIR